MFESAPLAAYAAEPQVQTVSENAANASEGTDNLSEAEMPTEEALTEEAQKEEAQTQEVSTEESPTEEVTAEETSTEETTIEEVTTEETSKEGEETTSEEAAEEETSTEEGTSEDGLNEESSTEEAASEDETAEETEETTAKTEDEALIDGKKDSEEPNAKGHTIQSTEATLTALTEGDNTITTGSNGEGVWYSFTVPTAGSYYFYTEDAQVSSTAYVRLYENQTDSNYIGNGYVDSYSQLKLLPGRLEANQTIYIKTFTYSTAETLTLKIEKIPEYSLNKQTDGSYLAETDQYTLSADLKMGYMVLKSDVLLAAKADQTLESAYYLDVYYQKTDSKGISSDDIYLVPEQNRTGSTSFNGGAGEYRVWFVLKNTSYKPLAVFEGNLLLTAKAMDAAYVLVGDPVITETSITLELETSAYTTCYYAPTDGSEAEKSQSMNQGWNTLSFTGLNPNTEYYFELVSNNVVLGTEKFTTLSSTAEVTWGEVTFTEGNKTLTINADVSGYQGNADYAYLYYEYTDALGRKTENYSSFYLLDVESIEGKGKSFTISASEGNPLVLGATTYEVNMWLEIDGAEYGRTAKQVQSQAATISDSDLSFTVSANETETAAAYTITAENLTGSLTAYILYKPQAESAASYGPPSSVQISEGTLTIHTDIPIGVPYDFVLIAGGVKKEVTVTVGISTVKLTPIGEAQVNAFDLVRTFKAESTDGQELSSTYYLHIYYYTDDESTWSSLNTIELNADSSYQADYSTAAYTELMPDTKYQLKWTLSTTDGYYATPVSVYYETISTPKADLSVEVSESYHDEQSYTLKLNADSVSNFTSFYTNVYAYLKKEGSSSYRQANSVYLSGSEYSGTLTLFNLEAETTYSLSLRSNNSTDYIEYENLTFTTPADTRELTVTTVSTEFRGAQISYAKATMRDTCVHLYIREKDGEGAWEQATRQYLSGSQNSGTLEVSQYNGKALKDETIYEYKIGFGEDDSTVNTIEKVVSGEFTTPADTRELTVTTVSTELRSAQISYTMATIWDTYIHLYIREKDGEGAWEQITRQYRSKDQTSGTLTVNQYNGEALKDETTYEYKIGFGEYSSTIDTIEKVVSGEFTTPADTRELTLTTVSTELRSAQINYTMATIWDTYVHLYVREKDSTGEWEQITRQYRSKDQTSGTLTVNQYNGEALKDETTYEYKIGFGEYSSTIDTIEKVVSGEFTTPADTRTLTIGAVSTQVRGAQIRYTVVPTTHSTYVILYVREKDSTGEWELATYQYGATKGTMTVNRYNGEVLKDETIYEYKIGFGNNYDTALEALEKVVSGEFTTPADTRAITVGTISIQARSARISYTTVPTAATYIHLYLREKGGEGEWDGTFQYHSNGQISGSLTVNRYNGEALKDGTTYEYKIGFGEYDSTIDTIEKVVSGEFTTKKDERKITTADVSPGYVSANISIQTSGTYDTSYYLYVFYREKAQPETSWIRERIWASYRPRSYDRTITGLKSGTTYEYAFVISDDYYCYNPDEITDVDLKVTDEIPTKSNDYTLDFQTIDYKLTYEKAVVSVQATGSDDDDPVEVVLTLSGNDLEGNPTLQESTTSLRRGNQYTREVTFWNLLGNTEYTITKAVFRVRENGQMIAIGEKAYAHKFTTPKAEVPSSIAFTEDTILLNAAYSEGIDGYSSKTPEVIITPQTAADDLVYESSNTDVAEVSSTGTVTARGVGEAQITVASKYDKNVKASCTVIVKNYAIGQKRADGSVNLLDEIKDLSMNKGDKLEGYGLYAVGTDNTPTLLSDAKVTPVKEKIVTWENGILEAVGTGRTRVDFEQDGVKAAIDVTVKAAGQAFAITGFDDQGSGMPAVKNADGSYTLALESSYTAIGKISPEQDFEAGLFDWSVSNKEIAEVDEMGNISPLKEGSVTLTVKASSDGSATSYKPSEVTVDLRIKAQPSVSENRVLYATTNLDKTLGDVEFPDDWKEDGNVVWSWKEPETPLVTNGAYANNSYLFTALYSGDKSYPREIPVQVYIGTITGVWAYEDGNVHNHVIETGGEDSIELILGVSSQGTVSANSIEFTLPSQQGLTTKAVENTSNRHMVTAQKAGKYTLIPQVKIGNDTLSFTKKTNGYSLTAVDGKQAATINVTSDTPGVTVSGNVIIQPTVSGNNILRPTVSGNTTIQPTVSGNTAGIPRSTFTIDTAQIKMGESFDLKAEVLDRLGKPLDTKLEWKTTDKSVVAVQPTDSKAHNARATIKSEGHAVITVTAKDKLGQKTQLDIELRDYTPRVSTKKATVNLAYDYDDYRGKELAAAIGQVEIVPAYGQKISSVQLLKLDGTPETNLRLEQYNPYGDDTYIWQVFPANYDISQGNYDCTLQVTTVEGGPDNPYNYDLKVTVLEDKPTVTARMSQKLNLFYTDTYAEFDLKISDNARADSVTWIDDSEGAGNGFYMSNGSYQKNGKTIYYVHVRQQDKLKVTNGVLADPGVAMGTLKVTLYGYRETCDLKDFKVNWQYKKPVLVAKAASTNIAPELGQNWNYFNVYNKTEKQYIYYYPSMNTSRRYFNEFACEDERVELVASSSSSRFKYTYTGEDKSNKIVLTLGSYYWRESLQVTHTIKARAAKARLTAATLTHNLNEQSTLSTYITLTNGVSISYTDIHVAGANAKAQTLVDKNLLVITADGNKITLKPSDGTIMDEAIPKGSYKYKVTPYYTNPTTGQKAALNTVTLTLKVVDKPITAKVSPKGNIDLANTGRYELSYDVSTKRNCTWVDPKFSNLPSGYTVHSITGYQLTGEYSNYFYLDYEYGHYYLTVSYEGIGKLKAGQNYKLAIVYTLENDEGEAITVTSSTFSIKPRQSQPRVTVENNNQTLYAGAEYLGRIYNLTVPDYYIIQNVSGSLDCNKDGIADILVKKSYSWEDEKSNARVYIVDNDAVITNNTRGKTYSIPVTIELVGRDGISKDVTVNIKVTVKR